MKIRKHEYGTANMVGRNIEHLRKEKGIKQKDFIAKLQTLGCDINPTSYSTSILNPHQNHLGSF